MTGLALGSRLRPTRAVCHDCLAKLRSRTTALLDLVTQEVASDASVCEAHNAYALYTTLCLLELTGHRPVEDPFCYRSAIAEGFAVIEDKAVTERHTTRPVVLCDTAMKQLRCYDAHLLALTERMNPRGRFAPLIPAIETLLTSTSVSAKLPYFFLLTAEGNDPQLTQSFIEGGLTASLGTLWPWPMNAGRHLIETRLRNTGFPSELIDFQLGHLLAEREYAGPASAGCLARALPVLAPALDRIAADYGFVALPGLIPFRQWPVGQKRATGNGYTHGTLGPERRKDERTEAKKRELLTVESLCERALVNGVPDQNILDDIVNQLEAFSSGKPHRLRRQLTYLWNWAYEHRPPGSYIRLPRRSYTLASPRSPFDRSVPQGYTRAKKWRQAFTAYLENASLQGKTSTVAQQVAETVLSAALHGALVNELHLHTFARQITTLPVRLGETILIPLPGSEKVPAVRWIADPLTAALLGRIKRDSKYNLNDVTAGLNTLLETLDTDSRTRNPWPVIAKTAADYWQYHLPGFVYADLSSLPNTRALPYSALVRLLRKVRLAALPEPENQIRTEDAPPIKVGGKGEKQIGKALLDAAREAFSQTSGTEAIGHERSNRKMKEGLCRHLRRALATCSPETPAIAKLCVLWAIYLSEHGTRTHRRLAFSTVERYFSAIATRLPDIASDKDFLELDAWSYEELYEQLLFYPDGPDCEYLAGRLHEFHAYLVDVWCVEPPDWSAFPLPREQLDKSQAVDANLLTPGEYLAALELLDTDPASDPATRLHTSALLVLGYRFGTRISDALRVRYDDLVLDPKQGEAILHVHTNIYGAPKSESGNRQIPLVGTLGFVEWRALTRLKAHFDERLRKGDPKSGLFADPEHPRAPIERRMLLDRIHLAIRTASGDGTLRYHHLRHSFATRLGVALFADLGKCLFWDDLLRAMWGAPPDARETRTKLTGTAELTDDAVQVLPCLLGHASAETSFRHYFHAMDGLIYTLVNTNAPALSARALSYATDTKYAAVRQRLQRAKAIAKPLFAVPVGPGWNRPIPEISLPLAKGRPPTHLPGNKKPTLAPTLEITDHVLLACAMRNGIVEGIADRLLLTEVQVQTIIEVATQLEARGGTIRVRVAPPDDQLFQSLAPETLRSGIVKETRRLRAGLRRWDERLRKMTPPERAVLREALQAWYESTIPSGGTAIFARKSHLKQVLEGLALLGVPPEMLQIVTSKSRAQALKESNSVQEFGPKIATVKTPVRANSVELRLPAGTAPFGYTATLSRAIYVVLVQLASRVRNVEPPSLATP